MVSFTPNSARKGNGYQPAMSRGPTNITNVKQYQPRTNINVPRSAMTATGTHLAVKSPGQALVPGSFKIGDIVQFPHLVPQLNPNETNPDYQVECTVTGTICPKVRYGIIAAVLPSRLVVLPMYSSGKKGVSRKPDEYKLTAISVWNPQDQKSATKDLLTEEVFDTQPGFFWSPGSHVNLADMVSIGYDWNITVGAGALTPRSKDLLKKRFWYIQSAAYQTDPGSWYATKVKEGLLKQRLNAARAVVPSTMATGSAVGTNVSAAPRSAWGRV